MNSEQHTTENKITIQQSEPLFVNINPDNPVSEIESFCVNCEENGITRILLTKIPFFKEIIIMAFDCPHCGYRNSEVQPGQSLADQALRVEVSVTTAKDLNRRVIKSEYATITCPELDLEIPPNTQKGKLTTIEGFISTTKEHFETALKDGIYSEMGDEFIEKINSFITKLSDALSMKKLPFKFIVDDPAGNSFVENPFAPHTDPYAKVLYYDRTKEVLESMGYSKQPEETAESAPEPISQKAPEKIQTPATTKPTTNAEQNLLNPQYSQNKRQFEVYKSSSQISSHLVDFTKSIETNSNIKEEALKFPTNCFCCYFPGEAYMCVCTIPYFKEIIISCFKCQECGYKTTDVKGGGGISEKATKLTLTVKTQDDLNRDLFKSETAIENAEMQLVFLQDSNYYSPGKRIFLDANYLIVSMPYRLNTDPNVKSTRLFEFMNLKAYADNPTANANIGMARNIKLHQFIVHQPAFLYEGTLTFPECQNALWLIMTQFHPISNDDLNLLKKAVSANILLTDDKPYNTRDLKTLRADTTIYRNYEDINALVMRSNLLNYNNENYVKNSISVLLLLLALLF